jgi:flagellar basal body rod protein FlgG
MDQFGHINEEFELKKEPVQRNIRNIMWIRQQEKVNVGQLGLVSFTIMTELKKESPNLDNIG